MNRENAFSHKLKEKTDAEVKEYIDNREKYSAIAVEAAIWELESRGIQYEAAENIQKEMNDKKNAALENEMIQTGIAVQLVPRKTRLIHFIIDGFALQGIMYVVDLIPFVELSLIFSFMLMPLYYVFFEYYFQWTPGKLATESVVVNANGSKPDLRSIILRTFIRLIPFEVFSFLPSPSRGWHDKWSDTCVIQSADVTKLREKNGQYNLAPEERKIGVFVYVCIALFIVTVGAGVVLSKIMTEKITAEGAYWLKESNEKDAKNILGTWNTNDAELGKLNFVTRDVVISNGSRNLNYKIENRILIITDNKGFLKNMIIVEKVPATLILLDADNPENKLVWTKL
ncbi:RDD family protein [Cytophaga hutchinsonii]|nr:RDD family protein [Cytophaga hutchinsonii]SFX51367.1 Uncharacterized membrane protein YckC, RDD family [Cytophaga hutchinsonii ATCC 33406]